MAGVTGSAEDSGGKKKASSPRATRGGKQAAVSANADGGDGNGAASSTAAGRVDSTGYPIDESGNPAPGHPHFFSAVPLDPAPGGKHDFLVRRLLGQ